MRPLASPARRRLGALIGAGALALIAATVGASHGDDVINLTTDNTIITHDGAVYAQGGVGAGTGTFDPFLTLSESPPSPAEQAGTQDGYNQCDDVGCPDERGDAPFYYDQFFGGGRTHELLVSAIPTLEYNNVLYREFSLDANDQGADTWMSIDEIKIFVDTQVGLSLYNDGTELFGNDTAVLADKIFDMDAGGNQTILVVSQGLESGSGVSDVTVLVPDSAFPAGCEYGSTTCDLYLYFWTTMGHFDGGNEGVDCNGRDAGLGTCDWNVTAGFEEWRIRFLPVVNIDKTAVESFTRDHDWTVTKTVSDDDIDLFDGQSQQVTWTVTPTRDAGTDSAFKVSGSITITNPTGSSPIPTGIPAEIISVEDVLTLDAANTNVTVSCPVTFPHTLAAGATLTCTYDQLTPSATATSTGTNTATVTIESGIPQGDGGIQFGDEVSYEGTASVDFSSATPTLTDDTATLTDDRGGLDQAAASGTAVTYNETFTCDGDAGSYSNTAVVTEDDSGDTDDDTASTTVTCYELTVTKDATPSFDRDFDWTVTKTVSDDDIDLFDGQSQQVTWTVTPTRSAAQDSNYAVSGTITITNPAPIAATGVAVADLISAGLAGTADDIVASVDCDSSTIGNQATVNVPAHDGTDPGSATCSYSGSLPDGSTRTNTATATFAAQNYSGSASVDFTGVDPTNVTDDTATLTDDRGPLDEAAASGTAVTYNETFTCGEDAGSQRNTAVVTEDDSQDTDDDTASTTVTCYQLTVTKDANTSFDRDYDWDISKTRVFVSGEIDGDLDPSTLVLDENQAYDLNYEVTVSVSGYTDANHAVAGTITVTNPAPIAADDVSVADLVSAGLAGTADDIVAHVDCDDATVAEEATVDVPANDGVNDGQATCAYWADLPNADGRTNTATATLFGEAYSGTAPVSFASADVTEIDECVNVTDDNGTPGDTGDDTALGTVCATATAGAFTAPKTFAYSIGIPGFAVCGPYTFTNVATYLAVDDQNDTGETDFATYTVNIEVPCPQGCTLTQGYWKTHNDSFWGGAPTDETWNLIGSLAEEETFFLSQMTYFDVMWTSSQGNVYFNLAHQYIAAQLNILDGADGSAIATAFADATELFEQYTDEQIATLKGKVGKVLRAEFVRLAGILASYNEGDIGPGHCDEDATSSSTAGSTRLVSDRRAILLLG